MAEASPVAVFFRELRRRRVFRTAGYYVVGAWLLLQAAEILFPGFGIPEAAIPVLLWAAIAGFPVVLVFGWLFDLGPDGIRRTAPATAEDDPGPVHLAGRDWTVLVVLAMILGVIAVRATQEVIETPLEPAMIDTARPGAAAEAPSLEKLENSVAVLPFDNLSDDPGNAYFCDGIAEEILHSLGRFSGVNVIGRTSSFAFRYDRPAAPRISELLGARFLLQGSVRKAGERVRIATQLLDEDGIQLWSETFDRDLEDAFAIQSEIAKAVSRTIAPRVAPGATLAEIPDPRAYDAYLRGLESFRGPAAGEGESRHRRGTREGRGHGRKGGSHGAIPGERAPGAVSVPSANLA